VSLLELLAAGKIDDFNQRRSARSGPDLFAADLARTQLQNADLSAANLEKADLTGADLTGAVLAKANLCGADLTEATLDRVVGVAARLREAYLGEARAVGAELSSADFTEADLTGLNASGARLRSARLRGASAAGAHFSAADLTEAKAGEGDFRGADFRGATMTEMDLHAANLEGAVLEQADLRGARMAGAILRKARLVSAVLAGADLTGADLTGADLTDVDFSGADLTETIADPGALDEARGGSGVTSATDGGVEHHFEEPWVASSDGAIAVLWENPEADESLALRFAVAPIGHHGRMESQLLRVPSEQVLSRAVVAVENGFSLILFVDKPGGVDVLAMDVDARGVLMGSRTHRLGYTPVVKPVFTPTPQGILIYGIGRQGALSVHRLEAGGLVELLRAPAATYRGFCGRMDPVLLGKGGTVAVVRPEGIGRLLVAPAGYPGRLVAAAFRPSDQAVTVAWAGKEEKGLRVQRLGGEALRVDAKADVGAMDLLAVGDRFLLGWTREAGDERDVNHALAAWVDESGPGKPFVLLAGDDDVEDIRFLAGDGPPRVALSTLGGGIAIVGVDGERASLLARLE
jgi:uncharacterized protein YjbI with pentapeptide repeats